MGAGWFYASRALSAVVIEDLGWTRTMWASGLTPMLIVSSVSQAFCGTCTRLRLSAEGKLYTCLFASDGTDVKAVLRSGAPDADIATVIENTWSAREDRYSELRGGVPLADPRVEMSYIGG